MTHLSSRLEDTQDLLAVAVSSVEVGHGIGFTVVTGQQSTATDQRYTRYSKLRLL